MINKYTKRIVCAVLMVGLLLQFSSCNGSIEEPTCNGSTEETARPTTKPVGTQEVPSMAAHIYRDDKGNCYVDIEDMSDIMLGIIGARIYFDTVEDFRRTMRIGILSSDQKARMSTFLRDEKGRILICDPDNLYTVDFPEGYMVYQFFVMGREYGYLAFEEDCNFVYDPTADEAQPVLEHKDPFIEVKIVTKEEYDYWMETTVSGWEFKSKDGKIMYHSNWKDISSDRAIIKNGDLYYSIVYKLRTTKGELTESDIPDFVNAEWFWSVDVKKYVPQY